MSLQSAKILGEAADAPMPAPPPPPPEAAGASISPEPAPGVARKVFYEGYVHVRVARPDEAMEAATALAADLGGRVERLYGTVVTLRVPVERFDEAVTRARALGDVVSSSLTALDVTEAFVDAELRLGVLRATHARLVELLARSRDEAEKVALIAEIQRVQEEIDALDARVRTLGSLAAMSRLTVELSARDAVAPDDGLRIAGLEWIGDLSPFRRDAEGGRVALDPPTGLVVLDRRGPWRAEGPDGTVLWTTRRPNEPVGDGAWWREALAERLSSSFASATPIDIGPWSCLELIHDGEPAYVWRICARAQGRALDVAQAWFPDPAAHERHRDAVASSLAGGAW